MGGGTGGAGRGGGGIMPRTKSAEKVSEQMGDCVLVNK